MKLKTTYKGANGLRCVLMCSGHVQQSHISHLHTKSSPPTYVLYRTNFRRAGPNTWVNLALGAILGLVSGQYIFGEPLRQYWEEARLLEQEQASNAITKNDKKWQNGCADFNCAASQDLTQDLSDSWLGCSSVGLTYWVRIFGTVTL
jgi:hypothetical protein